MKLLFQNILRFLARQTIRKYRPVIVGITGSVGKTSAREAIYAVLKERYVARSSEKNYNNEIGLPLAILGMPHHGKNIFLWIRDLVRASARLFLAKPYPEVLILEYGVDRPGDMGYLVSIARPHVAVVTAIGDVPVHVEFFEKPEDIVREKARLVEAVPHDGAVILNHDDYAALGMKDAAEADVLTYGFEEHADVKVLNHVLRVGKNADGGDVPVGMALKLAHKGTIVPVRLDGVFGRPQTYAAASAAAVGIFFGMNLLEISEALHGGYAPSPGRMRLLPGIKNSFLLDDTYNAAPESMHAALDTLKNLPGKRKIAVLGDMLEIGRFTEQVHRAVGDAVADFADILVTVGPRAKFIAHEAMTRGLEKNPKVLRDGQVYFFDSAGDAGRALKGIIQEGDLILVKGSQAMRMEKVVEEVMAHPERARELLVRQERYWKKR